MEKASASKKSTNIQSKKEEKYPKGKDKSTDNSEDEEYPPSPQKGRYPMNGHYFPMHVMCNPAHEMCFSGKRRSHEDGMKEGEPEYRMPPPFFFPPPPHFPIPPMRPPPMCSHGPHGSYKDKLKNMVRPLSAFGHLNDEEMKEMATAFYFMSFSEEGDKKRRSLVRIAKIVLDIDERFKHLKCGVQDIKTMIWGESPPSKSAETTKEEENGNDEREEKEETGEIGGK
ncbi:hypothetical protein ADUPG1_013950 [Aduncisulcus paluster]|uniref:Uncharacterized protein n=1 Tax=Aduncisulcus paluster TaxID=2918883 RepID=A0ABQ5K705_9EUKA|nr:hypothetical protein ADUPG1_013950 [Aduncisulcus paluster]|eukprot:gnl/Carplike_NY0171/2739_a3679_745.p1 GENE.gnl/Carplike_NY0171/2739_a3679_745~~gnl/Carplike_NY0171/2739_a3679_745.p1  ORF type:complete len:227 (+),score=67.33 gnl/Carplike_NY0171/2739_a3679_745:105-785(+)